MQGPIFTKLIVRPIKRRLTTDYGDLKGDTLVPPIWPVIVYRQFRGRLPFFSDGPAFHSFRRAGSSICERLLENQSEYLR